MVQLMATYPILTQKQEDTIFDVRSPACPFHSYVGNAAAVRIALRFARKAFSSYIDNSDIGQAVYACPRECPVRIILTGPRSVGKTTFARLYARLVGTNYSTGEFTMPFAEVDGTRIKRADQIMESIQQAWREAKMPMIPYKIAGTTRYYELPPMILFIDEVHQLPISAQEGLLKMSEMNDGIFELPNIKVDCRRIAMLLGTTKPGKLDRAFSSRFPIKIALVTHSLDELAEIIQRANQGWTKAQAIKLARMKPIPREALDIARLINITQESEGGTLDNAIDLVAKDMGLQDGAITPRAITVLQALADAQPNGLSKKNLCASCDNMDESEFENEIMPQLLRNQFHAALITVSSKHKITEAGLDELRKRNLIDY